MLTDTEKEILRFWLHRQLATPDQMRRISLLSDEEIRALLSPFIKAKLIELRDAKNTIEEELSLFESVENIDDEENIS